MLLLLLLLLFIGLLGADPYCKITCGRQTVITPIRKSTLEPQFDATAVFYVKSPADCTIKIQVTNNVLLLC